MLIEIPFKFSKKRNSKATNIGNETGQNTSISYFFDFLFFFFFVEIYQVLKLGRHVQTDFGVCWVCLNKCSGFDFLRVWVCVCACERERERVCVYVLIWLGVHKRAKGASRTKGNHTAKKYFDFINTFFSIIQLYFWGNISFSEFRRFRSSVPRWLFQSQFLPLLNKLHFEGIRDSSENCLCLKKTTIGKFGLTESVKNNV